MILNKKSFIDSTVIGAALFSMFFGAGNMIFPPFLGLKGGTDWFWGFLGYYIADIGLAIIALIAMARTKENESIFAPVGKYAAEILMFCIVLCIGPFISIPRTAATTYELSILPLLPEFNMPLFYIIFFGAVLLLCIKESAVVDIVGKILTPLLFIGLLFLIIKGAISPVGEIIKPRTHGIIADGIESGYQSLDVMAAIIFGVIILNAVKSRGYIDYNSKIKISATAGIISGIGLVIVYLGLTYLGATASSLYDMHTTRTQLLVGLIQAIIPGKLGLIFFAIIAGLACLSTAIAITSSAAKYFALATKQKVNYKTFVAIICVFGAVVSSFGVEQLIVIASPILNIIYPPILVLVLLSFFGKRLHVLAYRLSALVALIMGIIGTLPSFGIRPEFLYVLPFADIGLAWIVPSVVFGVIGAMIGRFKTHKIP